MGAEKCFDWNRKEIFAEGRGAVGSSVLIASLGCIFLRLVGGLVNDWGELEEVECADGLQPFQGCGFCGTVYPGETRTTRTLFASRTAGASQPWAE